MEAVAEHIKVPKLRFPEFSGEWEKQKLGSHCEVDMCKRIYAAQTTPNGEVPFFKIGTIGRIPDAYISRPLFTEYKNKYNYPEKGEVMITCSGTVGYSIQFDGEEAYFQDSNIVWLKNSESIISNDFLFLLITKTSWHWLGSTTIARIYGDDLRGMRFLIPSIPEQQKIAEFLTAVDEKIGKLKRKKELLEAYKKGAMQKLFSQEIRFKDDQGNPYPDWEEKRLGDCLFERSEKTSVNNQFEVLSSTAKGLFRQEEYFNRQIASKENIGYKILRKNQVVLSPQNLWLGNINLNQNFEVGIVSPSYKIFEISSEVHQGYLGPYLRIPRMFYEYAQASEQGASVVRRNLDSDLFSQIAINIPSLPEQQKIAEFLTGIDDKIKAVANQIDKAAEFKKGLLQKMFVSSN